MTRIRLGIEFAVEAVLPQMVAPIVVKLKETMLEVYRDVLFLSIVAGQTEYFSH